MVLEFEIIPTLALKNEHIEINLGTPINQVIKALQNVTKYINNVQFNYQSKDPLSTDFNIILKDDGIKLIFDSKSQVLKLIEIYAPSKVTLLYKGSVVSQPNETATIDELQKRLGPTHPAKYDEFAKTFRLDWLGISALFYSKNSAPSHNSYQNGLGSLNISAEENPRLENVSIFAGKSLEEAQIPVAPSYILCGTLQASLIEGIMEDEAVAGIKVIYTCENVDDTSESRSNELSTKTYHVEIRFGDSENDVTAALGSPAKIYHKSEDKMLIQRGTAYKEVLNAEEHQSDYFFNYFSMGLVS
uniref:NPL domain-containing protein n=1 Tax=Rhabditophanes sp. KR3021 TaxID=114890 RepID=A0AC35U9I6_9BILA